MMSASTFGSVRRPRIPAWCALSALALSLPLARAAAAESARSDDGWQFGAVLDAAATSRPLALGKRDGGLQLGHSDLVAGGPVGRHLLARVSASVATSAGSVERAIEEAWLETRSLPAGLNLRAGRLRSQIGYLNQQHPHADDFTDRPLLHRAFLGGHWYDDGLRLNLTLPTSVYWMVGAELLRGRQLVPSQEASAPGASVSTWVTKLGGDIGREHSWQFGVSHLANRRAPGVTEEAAHGDVPTADMGLAHDAHGHGARYTGRRLWLVDTTWKWAPDGNNQRQQLRTSLEAARVDGLGPLAAPGAAHRALALATVWRFSPNWELGARHSTLRVALPAADAAPAARLKEPALMLAWKPSHQQVLRVQWSRQTASAGFDSPARRSLNLQYVLAFGAHGAHAY